MELPAPTVSPSISLESCTSKAIGLSWPKLASSPDHSPTSRNMHHQAKTAQGYVIFVWPEGPIFLSKTCRWMVSGNTQSALNSLGEGALRFCRYRMIPVILKGSYHQTHFTLGTWAKGGTSLPTVSNWCCKRHPPGMWSWNLIGFFSITSAFANLVGGNALQFDSTQIFFELEMTFQLVPGRKETSLLVWWNGSPTSWVREGTLMLPALLLIWPCPSWTGSCVVFLIEFLQTLMTRVQGWVQHSQGHSFTVHLFFFLDCFC